MFLFVVYLMLVLLIVLLLFIMTEEECLLLQVKAMVVVDTTTTTKHQTTFSKTTTSKYYYNSNNKNNYQQSHNRITTTVSKRSRKCYHTYQLLLGVSTISSNHDDNELNQTLSDNNIIDDSIMNNDDENDDDHDNSTIVRSMSNVNELRRRAYELRQEVLLLEQSLNEQKMKKIRKVHFTIQNMMYQLFHITIQQLPPQEKEDDVELNSALLNLSSISINNNNNNTVTASSVAQRIQQERYNEQQIIDLMQYLYQLRNTIIATFTSSYSTSPIISNPIIITTNNTTPTTTTTPITVTSTSTIESTTARPQLTSFQDESSIRTPNNNITNDAYFAEVAAAAATTTTTTTADTIGSCIQLLYEASVLIDNNVSSTINDDRRSSTTNSVSTTRWSGKLASTVQSKLQEWNRIDQMIVRRRQQMMVPKSTIQQQQQQRMIQYTNASIVDVQEKNAVVPTIGRNDQTIIFIPRWIPPVLYKIIYTSTLSKTPNDGVTTTTTKLDPMDVLAIKERVLTKTRFFCTSSESFFNTAAIFRGNIRPPSPNNMNTNVNERNKFNAIVFQEIQCTLEREGLANTTQLFLLNDPDWGPNDNNVRERESKSRPVIVALPKAFTPYEIPTRRTKILQQLGITLAMVTAGMYAIKCYALSPIIFDGIVHHQDISVLSKCVPFIIMMFVVQIFHELTHYIMARKHHIRTGFPLLVPSFELGTFGCITPIKSFPSSRSSLFDFAVSGPLVGIVISLFFMIVGCYKTLQAPISILMTYPTIPLLSLKSSFLTGSILTCLLPKTIMMPLSHPIPLHPLFVAGYTSLIISALNLLPIFQLDGGRACTAVVGTRFSVLISSWMMLSLLSLALSGSSLAWTWGVFILLFQRQQEITCRDDVTPVGRNRTIVWTISLIVASLALIPFPGGIFL